MTVVGAATGGKGAGAGSGPRFSFRTGARVVVFCVLLLIGTGAGRAEAQRLQGRPNAEEAEEAIEQLRSPFCPGLMLETCTSPQAYALRDSIYDLAAQGATSDELVDWMLGNYGEEWRAVPPRTGAGLFMWLMPPLAIIVAGAFLFLWLRSNRAAAAATASPSSTTPITDAEREELAQAMRAWEDSGEEEL